MAIGLPSMAYGDGISKRKQVKFGGYNHTLAAENGDLWDMENLTSDFYPLLSPRTRRWTCRTLMKPNGLYAHDGLYWADGTGFYADGELKGIVTDGHKPRRVHRHPAGQEILQPPDGRLRRTGKQLEREREDSGRHLRGRGSKSQHHLRCGCGSKVQRGRRGDDLRRSETSGEQQDRHYPGD